MAKASLKPVDQEENVSNVEGDIPSFIEYTQDIESQERPPILQPGTYLGKIMEAKILKSQEKGNLYFAVTIHIDRDALPVDFIEAMGPEYDHWTGVYRIFGAKDTPMARFTLKKFLRAIGAPQGSRIDPSDWVGADVKVQIRHSKGLDGEPRAEAGNVLSVN